MKMKCLCNIQCRLLKYLDMFGKQPEIYYKGSPKKTSWIGMIFSVSFVLIYFAFFVYKLVRMLKKYDVVFYDTFSCAEEPPIVNLTNENFYGGFALEDPITYDPFINEDIYIPKAYFKRAEKKDGKFEWQVEELELERCQIEKFGSLYKEIFKKKNMQNYYCFKEMDFSLVGHYNYGVYSFFYIQFFPCINTTEKHNCKPLEEIDYYLKNTFLSFEFQDIDLNPNDYDKPFRPKSVDVYTSIGKRLFKEVHAHYQLVEVQTDMDWLGLDEITNIKSEHYLKFDELAEMYNILDNNIYETGESFCDFSIKLSEEMKIEKRTYTKLLTILGDVGGLMEVIFTIFSIISSFTVDILYDISLVNNLFNFDLSKKVVILKEKKSEEKKNKIDMNNIEVVEPKINKLPNNLKKSRNSHSHSLYSEYNETNTTGNRFTEDNLKNKLDNDNYSIASDVKNKRKKSRFKPQSNLLCLNNAINNIEYSKKDIIKIKMKKPINQNGVNTIIINNVETTEENNQQKKNIISKIKIARSYIYLCFCCIRRKKKMYNYLLDEGMRIISEKIDIFNIFNKMYRDGEIAEKEAIKNTIEMSDECKLKLKSL